MLPQEHLREQRRKSLDTHEVKTKAMTNLAKERLVCRVLLFLLAQAVLLCRLV